MVIPRESVPVDMRHQALGTGYKEIAALMRTRVRLKTTKSFEVASIERAVAAVRRLYYITMRGTVALAPYIPSFNDVTHDAKCFASAYPPPGHPKTTYVVAPVRRHELFSGAATAEQDARVSLLFKTCATSPCSIIERESTHGADVVTPQIHASIQLHVAALSKAYQYLLVNALCVSDAARYSSNVARHARTNVVHRFSFAATNFRRLALVDIIAFTVAGRWKRVDALTPLLSFLTCHAVIGMRDATLFVLYE